MTDVPMGGAAAHPSEADEARARLLGVAYRLLSSATEAEDAVQEAYARWFALDDRQREETRSPTAWLVTVVSRICLDVLGSARARRERYVGEWLPEPVPGDPMWVSALRAHDTGDPADRTTLDESVTMALLVVLETMTPAERVAFVLHDVLGYPFDDVATIVGRTPAACRQLAWSARRRVGERRRSQPQRTPADLAAAFRAAWDDGDVARLIAVLDPDVVAVTDGGGRVSAAVEPIAGADAVAAFLVSVRDREPRLTTSLEPVNGQPGIVARAGGEVLAVIALDATDGRIGRLWAVRNPAKLAHWPGTARSGSGDDAAR